MNTLPANPPQPLSPWHASLATLVITAALLLAYHEITLNGFHFDDWPNIIDNAVLHMQQFSLDALISAAQGSFLQRRPVASISFAIDWWRGGGSPAAFMVTNLALHILATWATFALIARCLQRTAGNGARSTALYAAGAAALWWALQPIHVQAVSYAVQRMTELAALFSVLCIWAYIRGRQAQEGRLFWFAASLIAFVFAALSKENAWITPLLLVMAEYLVIREQRTQFRATPDRLLVAALATAAIAILGDLTLNGPLSQWALNGYKGRDFTLAERLLTQPKVVLFHVSQLLWPMPGRFSLEHDVEIIRSAASWQFWLPMLAILSWCGVGAWLATRPQSRLAAFFMLWVPVTLVIESSFVPLELVFEHRMYFPAVGVAGLIAIGLARSPQLPRAIAFTAWAAVIAAGAFALWSTHQRIPHWRTEASLYEQVVKLAPNSARAWNHLGLASLPQRSGESFSQANYARAMHAFEQAIRLAPNYAAPWTNRGVARYLHGETSEARMDLEKAIAISSRETAAHHYLGEIYLRQGLLPEARIERQRACALGIAADCYRLNMQQPRTTNE